MICKNCEHMNEDTLGSYCEIAVEEGLPQEDLYDLEVTPEWCPYED